MLIVIPSAHFLPNPLLSAAFFGRVSNLKIMAQDSKIEWTHHTANLWWGCTKVHEGCDNCYAETLSKRWGNDVWGMNKPRKAIKGVWNDLKKYQTMAANANEMQRVFVGSMMDIFEKSMPMEFKGEECFYETGNYREQFFENIDKGMYPNLIFLLLTKRPSNINKYIPESWKENPPINVMFGTSPVNEETANKLIPQLFEVKGKRFVSIEPQLGWFNISGFIYEGKLDWVIQGGESGHHKRPFSTTWAREIRDACSFHSVPYFFKQIDKLKYYVLETHRLKAVTESHFNVC